MFGSVIAAPTRSPSRRQLHYHPAGTGGKDKGKSVGKTRANNQVRNFGAALISVIGLE